MMMQIMRRRGAQTNEAVGDVSSNAHHPHHTTTNDLDEYGDDTRSDDLGDDQHFHKSETQTAAAAAAHALLGRSETRAVRRVKGVVVVVLLASALGAALAVHQYIYRSEQRQFVARFEDDAHKLLEAIGSVIDRTLGTFDSLAVTAVSSARASNETWPFVTLPNFAVRMSKVLPLAKAVDMAILPLVAPRERRKWERYSLHHDDWVNESMAIQEQWSGYYGPVEYNWDRHGVIFTDDGDVPYNERYVAFVRVCVRVCVCACVRVCACSG
jgi:hypothetical protein